VSKGFQLYVFEHTRKRVRAELGFRVYVLIYTYTYIYIYMIIPCGGPSKPVISPAICPSLYEREKTTSEHYVFVQVQQPMIWCYACVRATEVDQDKQEPQ